MKNIFYSVSVYYYYTEIILEYDLLLLEHFTKNWQVWSKRAKIVMVIYFLQSKVFLQLWNICYSVISILPQKMHVKYNAMIMLSCSAVSVLSSLRFEERSRSKQVSHTSLLWAKSNSHNPQHQPQHAATNLQQLAISNSKGQTLWFIQRKVKSKSCASSPLI